MNLFVLKNKAAGQTALAATRMNAQGEQSIITCPAQNSLAAKRVIHSVPYTSFRRACGDGFLCKHDECLVVQEAFMGGPSSPKILYAEWQNEYQVALLELDRKKLLERVKAAESAIFNRSQAISPTLAVERQAIEDALANLRVIRRENLGLPVKQR